MNRENVPILHLLASLNYIDFFQYLHQEKQMSLKQPDENKYLPLHYACHSGSTEIALYILKEDPEESRYHQDGPERLPLLYAASYGGKLEIVKGLLSSGAKITDPWIDEFELLTNAKYCPDVLSFLLSQCSPNAYKNSNGITLLMNFIVDKCCYQSIEIVYRGIEDLKSHFYDRSGYHSFFEIVLHISNKYLKDFILKIIDDAIKFNLSIEPPQSDDPNKFNKGACYCMCGFLDLDVAKKVIKTKDFDINRFNGDFKLGPTVMVESKDKNVIPMLELLLENGFDINKRYNLNSPTLLESFICSISKNYSVIEFLVKYGADINALHSMHKDKNGKPMTLANYIKEAESEGKSARHGIVDSKSSSSSKIRHFLPSMWI